MDCPTMPARVAGSSWGAAGDKAGYVVAPHPGDQVVGGHPELCCRRSWARLGETPRRSYWPIGKGRWRIGYGRHRFGYGRWRSGLAIGGRLSKGRGRQHQRATPRAAIGIRFVMVQSHPKLMQGSPALSSRPKNQEDTRRGSEMGHSSVNLIDPARCRTWLFCRKSRMCRWLEKLAALDRLEVIP